MRFARLATPIGDLVLSGQERLEAISFDPHRGACPVRSDWTRDDGAFADAQLQLTEWFAGTRRDFDLDLASIGTPFQRRVWDALVEIPYGLTTTYAALARNVGGGARAVGAANGANPFAIVVPCHRLVASDGKLTGYAGGVDRKRWLLDLEARS
jgi:methylated-DNA-[protein]-cysteine S-methyltransferase